MKTSAVVVLKLSQNKIQKPTDLCSDPVCVIICSQYYSKSYEDYVIIFSIDWAVKTIGSILVAIGSMSASYRQ